MGAGPMIRIDPQWVHEQLLRCERMSIPPEYRYCYITVSFYGAGEFTRMISNVWGAVSLRCDFSHLFERYKCPVPTCNTSEHTHISFRTRDSNNSLARIKADLGTVVFLRQLMKSLRAKGLEMPPHSLSVTSLWNQRDMCSNRDTAFKEDSCDHIEELYNRLYAAYQYYAKQQPEALDAWREWEQTLTNTIEPAVEQLPDTWSSWQELQSTITWVPPQKPLPPQSLTEDPNSQGSSTLALSSNTQQASAQVPPMQGGNRQPPSGEKKGKAKQKKKTTKCCIIQ
eukprot:TRINITY_DN30602_c0_g1_i1.p1 TRINITY_DN30602_c0_g1~~TRINITY_DN30602_c0_g1_i1.p1  ORF type:complete len:283 (-),score=22.94 TRINITY_DN30602_c0_g1_i1:99-947(-)